MWLDFDVRDNRRRTFQLEEALLWIMDSYFGQKWRFEVKNILMMDLFLTNTQLLSSQDVNWWTGVVWIIVFLLSFWRHPFTAEHPLLSKWWNATFHKQKLKTKFSANFHFWMNYFFKLNWSVNFISNVSPKTPQK